MKNTILTLAVLSMVCGCGDGLVDHSKDSTIQSIDGSLVTGASVVLDTKELSGPCSSTTMTMTDSSGSGNNGTLHCSINGGKKGSGTSSDPYRITIDSNTYVDVASYGVDEADEAEMTWMAWVKPTSSSTLGHILSADDHAGAWNRSLVVSSNKFQGFVGTGASYQQKDFGSSVTDGGWQFVAIRFTSTQVEFLKNKTVGASFSKNYTANPGLSFTIGRSAGGNFDRFVGDVAWVAVYPSALTDSEINTNCKALQHRFGVTSCN